MLGGDHPAFKLLGLGLGLEALADPLALPPLRADIDQVPLGRKLDAHRPSLYKKAPSHLRSRLLDTTLNRSTLIIITPCSKILLFYTALNTALAVFN